MKWPMRKKVFPEVKEFFFDDDTFTANLPRAREIAKKKSRRSAFAGPATARAEH